ncbi:hypothetical protein [Acidisoma sp. 7E03]
MKVGIALVMLGCSAAAAHAQPVQGFYVSGAAGTTLPGSSDISVGRGVAGSDAPDGANTAASANAQINEGFGTAQSGSAGWGLGNGVRVEVQGLHTQSANGSP